MAAEFVDKETFEQEQSNIIKTLLTNRFFNPWREKEINNKSLNSETKLEIYATASCNQKCEYCYLVKYDELYPKEYNKRELIEKNLKILLNWIIENDFYIPSIEFFTGEIWHTSYGLKLLDIVFQAIKQGLRTDMILIPSNCSFILDEIQTQKIQHYINSYSKYNVRLCFSISVDGKIIDNYRPLNNKIIRNDKYYENLFLFAVHNNFYFHPMVAACNVEQWIENYKWWQMMCEKYNFSLNTLMLLEVRNDDWNEKSIKNYIDFLDYLLKLDRNNYKTNEEFFNHIFNFYNDQEDMGYTPWAITFSETFPGCTVCDSLTVRLGDMAICPCHRTAYNKFLYGHFEIENNKIIDIKGNNPEMASRILLGNTNLCSFQCDVCNYNALCLKGCFGAQYETEKDPFFPIESVCNLFKAKYSYLINTYLKMGIIPYLESFSPYNIQYIFIQKLLKFFKEFENVGKN